MRYQTPRALRAALGERLRSASREGGISLDVLRRRVIYERILARLNHVQPGTWVVKGGCALDIRMPDRTRATEDLDLGLRHDQADGAWVLEQLRAALAEDPDSDSFTFRVGDYRSSTQESLAWRFRVWAHLGGSEFGTLRIDVARRSEGLDRTDHLPIPCPLEFAGISTHSAEVIDVNRHAAEKFHALTRTYDDRPNSRVRDLVDLVLLIEFDLIDNDRCSEEVCITFRERHTHDLPSEIAPPPTWRDHYEQMASELDIEANSFDTAAVLVRAWWTQNLGRKL